MNRIKELRAEHGMTQAQLAKALGVNQTAVGKYEREELEPNLHNLTRMATIFRCSIDYLIGYTNDFGAIILPPDPTTLLTEEEQRLLTVFKKLSPVNRLKTSLYAEIRLEDQNAPRQR